MNNLVTYTHYMPGTLRATSVFPEMPYGFGGTEEAAFQDLIAQIRATCLNYLGVRGDTSLSCLQALNQLEDKPLSDWTVVEGHCAMRYFAGTDPEDIANRVAMIEKTPRVRVAPFITDDNAEDGDKWEGGSKGRGGGDPETDQTYGFDPNSRAWCDTRLRELGYSLEET